VADYRIGDGGQSNVVTRDEWDQLVENLNLMLDRIEGLMGEVKQVIDNVAHDLQTPLARIRGRLEKGFGEPRDGNDDQSLIGDTIADLDGVLRMFASLMRISQIEANDRTAASVTVAAFGSIPGSARERRSISRCRRSMEPIHDQADSSAAGRGQCRRRASDARGARRQHAAHGAVRRDRRPAGDGVPQSPGLLRASPAPGLDPARPAR
jgi:signal transduction histidine kinase